jgi:hypothetical protein
LKATYKVQARNNQGAVAPPTGVLNLYDFNRDALIDATDQIIARNNQGSMPWLALSAPPAAPDAPASGAPDGDEGPISAVASALAIAAPASAAPPAALLADAGMHAAVSEVPDAPRSHTTMEAPSRTPPRQLPAVELADVDLILDDELLDLLLS